MQSPLCFTLGKNAVYRADEVLIKRKYKGQHEETLVKWVSTAHASVSDSTDKNGRHEEPKEYLVWMRNDEIRACCPHLVSTCRENRLSATVSAGYEAGVETEDSIQEMAADVSSLVNRAKRIMSGKRSGKQLSNTINILGAYTKIPSLADTFRECGALDLLLYLLSSQDPDVRKSSNDMLRSLAACDPTSRTYVFLQLAREDTENVGAASTENHQMLLDLFAETASNEELGPILSGVTFPQVPGRLLFTLLKMYLRVSSPAVKGAPTNNNNICAPPIGSSHPSNAKFEAFHHLFQLVTELFSVFSWYEADCVQPNSSLKGTSIFTGTTATDMAASALKRARCAFKKRSDFQSEQEYAQYVKDSIRPGMRVKAIVTYESVSEGDRGVYRQTNNGTPPAQFAWDGLGGETYWVYWHQVELLAPEGGQQESDEDVVAHSVRQPYILKALTKPPEKGGMVVQRDHWWELLCLLKDAPSPHMEEICALMGNPHIKCIEHLIDLLPSLDKVAEVLKYVDIHLPYLSREPLSVRHLAHVHNSCTAASGLQQNPSVTPPHASGPLSSRPQAITSYRTHPPYPDPYDVEPPPKNLVTSRITPPPDPLSFLQSLSSVQGFLRNRQEEVDPMVHLHALQERVKSGCNTLLLDEARFTIEGLLNKYSKNCHLALQSLLVVRAGAQSMSTEIGLVGLCEKGFLSLVLRLMYQSPTSCCLQCIGLECLFLLVGGATLDKGFLASGTKPTLPDPVGILAMTTLHSIFSRNQESESVRSIVQAVRCVVDNYNLQMSTTQKKYCVTAVEHGFILLCLLLFNDAIAKAMKDWSIDGLLEAAQNRFPNFPAKKPLCHVLSSNLGLPYGDGPSTELSASEDDEGPLDLCAKTVEHVAWVIGALRNTKDLLNKNPLSRLLDIIYPNEKDPFTHSVQLVCPPPLLTSLFLAQRGVFHLARALEECRSQSLSESTVVLLGCLVLAGREEAAQVVLQGGLRTLLECMRLQESNKQIQLLCCQVLNQIAKDSDNLAVMAAESVGAQMTATMEKFKDEEEICKICIHLIEVCGGSDMVARAELHTKILAIIFSGVLKLILDSIEDSRRDREPVCIPKLAAFMQYLSTGSGSPLKSGNKDSGFDKVEVSSNTFRLQKLLDGDSSTYWETSGRSGTHWIRLHFHHGMVIKRLAIEVNANDSSYMPQKVTVQGGISPETVTDLCTVNIPVTFTGYYDLLVNAKKHYPVVMIRLKRCHQGGIDTRVHGLVCQCMRASLWPVFGDLFSARTKLFYYIQMHTWLADPSLQPLELFDRLNVIITHEQAFADSYLWTSSARRCLGQACRVSLITPLIQRLTQAGQSGAPILGSMIQCYISQIRPVVDPSWRLLISDPSDVDMTSDNEEGEEDQNAVGLHSQLVQLSRTRRLCRLLVDCDSTGSGVKLDGEEKGEEPGIVSGVGLGTAAMSACWREIAVAEVQRALCSFEFPASPHAVAADLISVYDRLKQAMVELFGGHSNFALGLKEGFSKAFQSLNEVTGVRFSESLCQCIEGLMDCVSKESHRLLPHISESKREALLLSLAEPLQFMHSLDLAHVFEHYYRRHLSLRLLQGRSISVPLEKRLAHAFAHCFPHKYPLQMLTDLEESSAMMDRFCDSELLENIDRLMAQVTSPDLVTSEAVELAQKYSFYRQRKLQVLTLNPCYWPLRHRPMPSHTHLPKPLSSFCEDYERFFTTVRAYGLQQHEKARRLHWTLHGWAQLSYGRLRLAITTTQMIVLLQFNQAQELSFKHLQDNTGLSDAELCDALLALTAERHSLLLQTFTQTSSSSIESNASSLLEEEGSLQGTPFRASSSFKLNEDFSRDLTRHHSAALVRFQDIRLVSRGAVPNHEERAVGLAHVFERRRAIIDSAIVRLLKREKEMSVDNIAMQIIKGCGAGKFDQGASFGRFDCTFRDVCSRINRLVLDSYVKRDENNQHMLAYVQDPIPEGTGGGAGVQSACNDGPKEDGCVATPGAPPTQNGPESLELKDKALADELDLQQEGAGQQLCASPSRPHSRKRPGASKPPVVRLKRKPQVSRMCAGELYERDDLPLVTMFASTNSKSVGEVQAEIDQALGNISQVLHTDVDAVEHLLIFCHWNKDGFIQRYLQNSASLLKEAGLPPSDELLSSPPDGEPILCPVCLQTVLREESCWLWCGHACCVTCWKHHLLAQIEGNTLLQSSCPTSGCHACITRHFFVQLLGEGSEAMKKFNMAVVRSYVEGSGRLTWCRNPQGCDQVLCKGDGIDSGTCQKCQWSSCFSCSHTEAHQPASCVDMTKWVETGGFYEGMGEDAKSKQLANMISKRCPSCNAQIEKNEGCLHMKCKCGHGFCWKCLKPWKPTHSDYYNCLSKIGKAARDHKKFADVNQRCISHHRSKAFAEKLGLLVKGITEVVPIKNLTFIMDACRWLFQCHKMLGYACVAEYFSQPDTSAYLWLLSEELEGDTNALQALLENTLLSVSDVAHAVRTLPERRLAEGYRLVGKIESTREKILLGFHQQFKLGEVTRLPPNNEQAESSLVVQDPDTDSTRPAFGHLGNLMSQEASASDHDGEEDDISGEEEDALEDDDDSSALEDHDDLIYSDYEDQFIYDSEYYDSDYSL